MFKKLFLISLLISSFSFCYSQDLTKMNLWQDSLLTLGTRMYGAGVDAERIENNYKFVKVLVSSLKEANAFFYAYDKLKIISIINSPDDAFRIFSWNIPLNDGSFLYYGCIQYKGSDIKLLSLLDKTFQIKDCNTSILEPKDWYGAQYYDILPLTANQYILLGWKGHHADYSKKVIEVLNIQPNGEVTFGATIFSNKPHSSRIIFSYTKQASMYLKYNKAYNRIEFDHIVPADSTLKENYKYYGPDLTYDGYSIDGGHLNFMNNIELFNPARGNEDNYIDPHKPLKSKKSGLKE